MLPIQISISNAVKDYHDPFQEITDLEGCSLAGLGSALPRHRLTVTLLNKELALCRQVRRGRTMDPVRADIVKKLYSGDQAAAPFLDPEPPVEVRLSVKHLQQDGAMRRHQTWDWCLIL